MPDEGILKLMNEVYGPEPDCLKIPTQPRSPVTKGGTDFRTWSRENLELIAADLTNEVIRLRNIIRKGA